MFFGDHQGGQIVDENAEGKVAGTSCFLTVAVRI